MEVRQRLSDLVSAYAAHLRQEEKSPATIEKYSRYAKRFLRFAGEGPLSKDKAIAYKEHVSARYSAAGANGMLAAINGLFAFLNRPELRVRPLKVQRRHFVPREKELNRGDMDRLLKEARRRGKRRLEMIIQTLFATGIRVSELRYITVDAMRSGRAEIHLKGKVRTIFLPDKLCQRLRAYAAERRIASGPVFITRSGRPVDRSNIWGEMKRLCRGASVAAAKVYPHNLRHLFARIYYRKIPDLVELAGIMGHSDINTTRMYAASSDAECRKRLNALHLV